VKADGGYHGSWEQTPMRRDEAHRGTPAGSLADLRWVDYNDTAQLEAVMAADGEQVAAVILEPVLGAGGVEIGEPAFLAAARRLADENGALLILDEVMTLRLAPGGRQAEVGITPDLTTLGKIIGGGLPVGAIGGRADVLDQFDPRRSDHVEHGGTGNGNPLTMAAGLAAMQLLTPVEIERINALGARLAEGLRTLLGAEAVRSCGSLVQITRDAEPMHRAALANGLFFAQRGLLCTSTAMDEQVVDEVLERFHAALAGGSAQSCTM
jgi:glutamate-1-semialdehyde 2,1-aminomutase